MSGPKIAAKSAKTPKSKAKRRKNPPQELEQARAAARDRMRRVYEAKSPAERAMRRFRQQARPPTPGRSAARATIVRDLALSAAYCDWSDIDAVVRMYVTAAILTELTGRAYVVDHQVPLNHPLVCGLHTHTNMRVITDTLNRMKGHWIWPDMWPHDQTTIELLEQLAEEQQDRLEAANHEHSRTATRQRRAGA
jgi:hypothetical protein